MENARLKLQVLSQADMEKIHERSLFILENVGMKIPYEKGLHALAEAGAKVDFTSEKVTFPKSLVEHCLKTAPKKLLLAGRDPRYDLPLPHLKGGF